jgi:hypothetical protein
MAFDPNKIPIWLRRTAEQKATDDALQERLRSAMGPGIRPNQTERHLLRAQAIKRSAEGHLTHLYADPAANPAHVAQAEAQMAEALAMLGDFTTAAEMHPSPEHGAHFRAIANAIDRDDAELPCHCPLTEKHDEQSNRKIHEQHTIISEHVFSPKHGRLMPVVKCAKCGSMNVRPAPAHLNERARGIGEALREARAKGARHAT